MGGRKSFSGTSETPSEGGKFIYNKNFFPDLNGLIPSRLNNILYATLRGNSDDSGLSRGDLWSPFAANLAVMDPLMV